MSVVADCTCPKCDQTSPHEIDGRDGVYDLVCPKCGHAFVVVIEENTHGRIHYNALPPNVDHAG